MTTVQEQPKTELSEREWSREILCLLRPVTPRHYQFIRRLPLFVPAAQAGGVVVLGLADQHPLAGAELAQADLGDRVPCSRHS